MTLSIPPSSAANFPGLGLGGIRLLLTAVALILGGGALALLSSRRVSVSSACAVVGTVLGAATGEVYAFRVLLRGADATGNELSMPWNVPYGHFHIAVDPLSAFFLVPIFGLSALAAVYGREYLRRHGAQRRLGFTWFVFNLLVASLVLVVVARQALLFLFAWEVMSISAYLLVTFEHEHEDVRRAGWVYLIATHVGTAFLVVVFLLLDRQAKSFDFDVMRSAQTPGSSLSSLLFGMALVGFGVKAGFVPGHVWLPEAHAAAPSHVSALMSGVLIKMGLYGLLRMLLLLGRPAPWCGPVLMTIGLTGALLGIAVATYQRDMKRVLAYSSIENMGLIALGLGTGLWGLTSGRPQVAVLGTTGALLHVWNHSLMKGLMFLGAGNVLFGCHTKDLEQLGGVMKRMPRTGATMVVGAVAISGLPPLNGFVSEWLIYLGLIEGGVASGGATSVAVLLSVGIVALVGGLAMLCFVRLIGIALLGEPRSEAVRHAREPPWSMTAPLIFLAMTSVAVALFPGAPLAATARVLEQLLGSEISSTIANVKLDNIGLMNAVLWTLLALGALLWRAMIRGRTPAAVPTWDCGYAKPSARMQYTSRSFAELISEQLLPERLRARLSVVAPTALFPKSGTLSSECTDPLTRGIYEPFLSRWADRFARLRWLQQGMLHVYLAYILVATLIALGWISLMTWSGQ